jgi:arylsulfatase A-like enzyme
MEVPDDAPYGGRAWPAAQRNHAAMISRLDRDVGRLLDKLDDLGMAQQTLVLFSSDNGPHAEGGADPAFFGSSGGLRGHKRDLYEGGIRVPCLAWWPSRIAPGGTSSLPAAHWDILPTLAELGGAEVPAHLDGLSLVPTLLGESAAGRPQAEHEYLYWEFFERGFQQAVRIGPWKGMRLKPGGPLELYDLEQDPGETHNVRAEHPEVAEPIKATMRSARTESPDWPVVRD